MKKLLSLSLALLMGLQLFAVDFLVQTGASTDAKWDASVATATSAVIVDLTTEGKAVNAWIADNATGKEVWFAAGTYTFTAAAAAKANWKLYGGFAGTETSVEARQVGANAWDMQNATIFDGGGAVQLFSGNAAGQTYDGLTMQNANFAGNASVMRLGNNGIVNACRVVNNAATTAGAQGSIQIYNGNATFKNSYFAGNEAGQGGALYLAVATQTVTVSDCRFENNFVHSTSTAANSGGAIQIQGAGTVTVERSFFVGNRVDNAKNGAAISQANTNAATTIANNVITGSKGSPALYAVCGKIYNNTIANNEDGALNVNNGSNLIEIVNNVLFGSETTGKVNVNNNANLTFNNNATIVAVTAPNATMADNIVISTDNTGSEAGVLYASFTDPATGNFLPLTGSALIDKGADIAAITMDIAGTSRPQFDKYDIGAYEVIDPSKLIPNYIMTLTVDGQGTVANGTRSWTATATDTIHEGKLQITPAVGYYIQTLSINGVAVDEPGDSYTTDDVTADINVNVVFKKYNTVTLTITGEGKVAYDGTEYTANTNFNLKDVAMTLTITPAKGFKVGSMTVNGTDVTASLIEGVYTTETLTADAAIVVKFVDEVPIVVINGPVHVKAGGTGDGSTWENAMGDIHRAIRTARADDKNRQDVWIAGGHYVIESIITLNDSISIYGGFAGTENDPSERQMVEGGKPWEYQNLTIIDGDNKTACMTANKAMEQAIVIDGVVLQNGYIEGNGGGIRTNYNVTLKNSIVRNCSAINGAGGGIQIYPAGDVYNCLIENNKQTLNANGGGGICANTSSNGYTIHIEGNTIVGNTSNIRGGAINCQGSTPYYIVGNTIYNNTAVDGDALKPGGAIYDNGQNVSEMSNNLVYNNSGATVIYLKPHLFVNNTVVKNVGNVYMATTSGQNTLIRNNIIWGGATDNTGVTPTSFGGVAGTNTRIYNNAVYNPLSEDKNWDMQGNFQFSSNNSNGDVDEPTFGVGSGPKFVKPTTFIGSIDGTFSDADRAMFIAELENADWHLNYNSPCVNTGSADDDYVIDLDGIGRPQGGAFDIGCYELPYYNIVIANYDQLPGMIYTEEGIELDGGSTMSVAKGQDLVIYILANDDTPMRVTMSYSTDGGLTFDGETVDITDQVGDDGKLTIAGTQDAQISLTWNPGAGVAQTAADKYQIIGLQNEIRLAGLQQGDLIRVYSTTGQLINSMRAESLTQHISIESGLYIVRVNDATLKVLVP